MITEEDQARREWKAKVKEGNDQEVESKSSLGWYRMAKNEFRNLIWLSQGQEAIKCWFRHSRLAACLLTRREWEGYVIGSSGGFRGVRGVQMYPPLAASNAFLRK